MAKQAKPQADKAAQIITGAAQGIKENAEPTAKVCLTMLPAYSLLPWLLVTACCTWAPATWPVKPHLCVHSASPQVELTESDVYKVLAPGV